MVRERADPGFGGHVQGMGGASRRLFYEQAGADGAAAGGMLSWRAAVVARLRLHVRGCCRCATLWSSALQARAPLCKRWHC